MSTNNIKKTPPTTRADSQSLEYLLGIDKLLLRAAIGINNNAKYSEILGKGCDSTAPLDFARAIMVRFLLDNPELWPYPKQPSFEDTFDLINQYVSMSQNEFGNLFGAQTGTGYRWISDTNRADKGAGPEKTAYNLIMYHSINNAPASKKKEVINKFIDAMKSEAVSRGYSIKQLDSIQRFEKK